MLSVSEDLVESGILLSISSLNLGKKMHHSLKYADQVNNRGVEVVYIIGYSFLRISQY